MFYIRWTRADITGLPANWDVIITELDEEGQVHRELALDLEAKIIHRAPTAMHGRGLFEGQRVRLVQSWIELSREEFERLWQTGDNAADDP